MLLAYAKNIKASLSGREGTAPESPALSLGWIAAGRLMPFGDARHLRSPGTIFSRLPEPGLARQAAETFARLEESMRSALALEAAILSAFFGIPFRAK